MSLIKYGRLILITLHVGTNNAVLTALDLIGNKSCYKSIININKININKILMKRY